MQLHLAFTLGALLERVPQVGPLLTKCDVMARRSSSELHEREEFGVGVWHVRLRAPRTIDDDLELGVVRESSTVPCTEQIVRVDGLGGPDQEIVELAADVVQAVRVEDDVLDVENRQ